MKYTGNPYIEQQCICFDGSANLFQNTDNILCHQHGIKTHADNASTVWYHINIIYFLISIWIS